MMTGVAAGMLIAALAAWLWQQLSVVSLPAKAWSITLRDSDATVPAPGASLTLLREGVSGLEEIGVAAAAATPGGTPGILTLTAEALNDGRVMQEVTQVRAGEGAAILGVSAVRSVPIFEQVYLQAGAVAIVLLVGAILVYRYVGVKRSTVEFLIATDAEMKKVNWSTRKHVVGSTWVVVGACVLLVLLLFLIDVGFSRFFRAIDLLQG